MLYNFQKTKLCKHLLVGGALFAVSFGLNSCTDTYDLDTEQPGGLNSIYGYIADKGNFQNYMRIIEDLGQEEILSKTGSKTLFLANDEAFEEFYASNDWGVSSYEELTLAQKKLLLGAAMIDNPYTTSMLSTAQGPVRGEVCRRVTSQTLYDSVDVVKVGELDKLPSNSYWSALRAQNEDVVLFRDNSMAPPTVHFTPKFLTSNKLTSEDLEFIYRIPAGTSGSDDVYVGRAKIVNSNIFCKNGFIHEVDRVMVPLDNMAEILKKSDNAQVYSSLVERFAAPYYTEQLTDAYNLSKGTEVDSVFIKRYFSKVSQGKAPFEVDIFENKSEALLKFDPGWNAYIPTAFNNRDILMEDMGVILAPTDQAMHDWWYGEGTGKLLRNRFGGSEQMENVPTSIVAELLNNNFLEQLTLSLPSKFNETVLDDANEVMGLETKFVDNVSVGCNGLVYYTNKVFEPAAFRSVLYPAVVNDDVMGVIKYIIEQLDYKAYLNSMVSEYTLFIPTNKSMLTYVDPVTYGKNERELWQITLNPDAKHEYQRLHITRYRVSELTFDPATGTYITEGATPIDKKPLEPITSKPEGTNVTPDANVLSRLENILDNIIVIGKIEEGKEYYPTKGRNYLHVNIDGVIQDQNDPTKPALPMVSSVTGTWQVENDNPLSTVSSSSHDNGFSYVVDAGIPSSGSKSVADVLSGVPECSEFYEMLKLCAVSPSAEIGSSTVWWAASQRNGNLINIAPKGDIGNEAGESNKISYLLNGYHYTVFAPTNEAMQKAYEQGLPTIDEYLQAEEFDANQPDDAPTSHAKKMLAVMLDFVKYHIMDNSIYMDNGFKSGDYQTAKIKLVQDVDDNGDFKPVLGTEGDQKGVQIEDEEGNKIWYWIPRKPYNLSVSVSKTELTVTDVTGNVATVDKQAGYNMQAVEYWLTGGTKTVEDANRINTTSSAVIHAINTPLIFDNTPALNEDGTAVKHPLTGKEIKYNQFRYLRKDLSKQQ